MRGTDGGAVVAAPAGDAAIGVLREASKLVDRRPRPKQGGERGGERPLTGVARYLGRARMHRAGLALDGVIARPSAGREDADCATAALSDDVSSGGQLGLLSARAIE